MGEGRQLQLAPRKGHIFVLGQTHPQLTLRVQGAATF
jgi:hypothetical protein